MSEWMDLGYGPAGKGVEQLYEAKPSAKDNGLREESPADRLEPSASALSPLAWKTVNALDPWKDYLVLSDQPQDPGTADDRQRIVTVMEKGGEKSEPITFAWSLDKGSLYAEN